MTETPSPAGGEETNPTFSTVGPSTAAQGLQSTLESLEATMRSIVKLSKEMADNLSGAQAASSGTSSNIGTASISSGPVPTPSTTGKATETQMVTKSSLGRITSNLSAGQSMSQQAVNAAAGRFGVPATTVAVAAANVGMATADKMRIDPQAGLDQEWYRYRAGFYGNDFDKMMGQTFNATNMPTDPAAARAMAAYASESGLAGRINLQTTADLAALTGIDPTAMLQANAAFGTPEQAYGLAAMGVQSVNPDGTPVGQADLANQIYKAFYGGRTDITQEDINTSFNPQTGNIARSLRQMGMSDEQIQTMKTLLSGRVQQGGALSEKDISRLTAEQAGETPGRASQRELALNEQERVEEFTNEFTAGLADANAAIVQFHEGLMDTNAGLYEAANYLGSFNDAAKQAGFKNFATLVAGSEAARITGDVTKNGVFNTSNLSNMLPWNWDWNMLPWNEGGGREAFDTGASSNAEGDWNISSDKVSKVHQGEMVLPARIATAVRSELGVGQVGSHTGPSKGSPPNVNISVHVARASEAEAVRLAQMVKRIIKGDRELSGLGLGQVAL